MWLMCRRYACRVISGKFTTRLCFRLSEYKGEGKKKRFSFQPIGNTRDIFSRGSFVTYCLNKMSLFIFVWIFFNSIFIFHCLAIFYTVFWPVLKRQIFSFSLIVNGNHRNEKIRNKSTLGNFSRIQLHNEIFLL